MEFAALPVLYIGLFLVLAIQGNAVIQRTQCWNPNDAIELEDPFPEKLHDAYFVSFGWAVTPRGETKSRKLLSVNVTGDMTIEDERWEIYQYWGLRLANPTLNDSGLYRAVLSNTKFPSDIQKEINLTLSEPPSLKSSKLSISQNLSTFTCGTVDSPGIPPVTLVWEVPYGTVILSKTYVHGNSELLTMRNFSGGVYSCEVDDSPASECIPPYERSLWKAQLTTDVQSLEKDPYDLTRIVAIVCGVVLLVVHIIAMVEISRNKKTKAQSMELEMRQSWRGSIIHPPDSGGGVVDPPKRVASTAL